MTSPSFKKFNDKVTAMNQAHSKELRLTADEARNLHTALFSTLDKLADLQERLLKAENEIINVSMGDDKGNFF